MIYEHEFFFNECHADLAFRYELIFLYIIHMSNRPNDTQVSTRDGLGLFAFIEFKSEHLIELIKLGPKL